MCNYGTWLHLKYPLKHRSPRIAVPTSARNQSSAECGFWNFVALADYSTNRTLPLSPRTRRSVSERSWLSRPGGVLTSSVSRSAQKSTRLELSRTGKDPQTPFKHFTPSFRHHGPVKEAASPQREQPLSAPPDRHPRRRRGRPAPTPAAQERPAGGQPRRRRIRSEGRKVLGRTRPRLLAAHGPSDATERFSHQSSTRISRNLEDVSMEAPVTAVDPNDVRSAR
eukprot:scaffold2036_cov256-Pinguiococcus_pyrenoidosus.AAC.17